MIWEGREYVNPRKKVFKNLDTGEILNLEIQDDEDNIIKESQTPMTADNLNLAQQELADDLIEELSQTATHTKNGMMSSQDKILLDGILDIIENAILDADKRKHPIGSLEFNTSGQNPSSYLGFGTWVAWGSGRVPVGIDSNDSNFNTVEKTGGSSTVSLTTAQMPSHTHGQRIDWGNGSGNIHFTHSTSDTLYLKVDQGSTTKAAGDGEAHNNLQPYITCYIWKRTA